MTVSSHALLPVPFEALCPLLMAAPVWQDRGRVEPDGTLHVTFGIGQMRVYPCKGQSELAIDCEDEAGLQALRDFITAEAEESGVTPEWREHHLVGHPANLCIATLDRIEQISPAYRRLWLRGAGLSRLMSGGMHFRLLLGPEGAGWPRRDTAGLTVWPGGSQAWHRPVYTVRALEGVGEETRIAVDIFLHDGGRVTEWSARVQPGASVGLMGPSGGDAPQGSGAPAPWFGLFGDETALPAMARILAELPRDATGLAVVQVPADADRQALMAPAGVQVEWLLRDGDSACLLDRLTATDVPDRNRFVYFAASNLEAAEARKLLAGRGLDKREFWAQAYWQSPDCPDPEHDH